MKTCSRCGTVVADQALTCPVCGIRFFAGSAIPARPYSPGLQQTEPVPRNGMSAGSVSFGEAVGLFFKQYAAFKGRSSRSEFWYAWLFLRIVDVILGLPSLICGVALLISSASYGDHNGLGGLIFFGVLRLLVGAGTFLPNYAVQARRLQDAGKSGWLVFLHLVPLGSIVLLFLCGAVSDGDNKWGPAWHETAAYASAYASSPYNGVQPQQYAAPTPVGYPVQPVSPYTIASREAAAPPMPEQAPPPPSQTP